MNTFYGHLTSSPVFEDNSAYIKFLERKIVILEDIVNTSHVIAELSEAVLSKQSSGQLADNKSDIGIQTDFDNVGQMNELQYDSLQEVPHSYLLTDSDGVLEFPESMLSINGTVDSYSEIVNPWTGTEELYDNLSSVSSVISTKASSTASLALSFSSVSDIADTVPVEQISDAPFEKFSLDRLLSELEMTHHFSNRSSVYYGEFDYNYSSNIVHKAKEVPESSYLSAICSYMDVVFPDYEYNSILINLYNNGSDYIPPHSDNEDSIEDLSYILTISLGATRNLKFTEITSGSPVHSIESGHGDVFVMSKSSQSVYRHELIQDPHVSDKRVDLTFRLIKPQVPHRSPAKHLMSQSKPDVTKNCTTPIHESFTEDVSVGKESGYVPYRSLPSNSHNLNHNPMDGFSGTKEGVDSLFISSSMFRDLDAVKLSSEAQCSKVLFYPGATSAQMLQRLLHDPDFISINKMSVNRIFLLTGTNYVDAVSSGKLSIDVAKAEIDHICCRLWELMPNAKLNVINVLPRESKHKNGVVNEINYFIKCMCKAHGLTFVDTEQDIGLFSYRDGRKNNYFKSWYDDVHLNRYGVARLAKHLKYLAHRC